MGLTGQGLLQYPENGKEQSCETEPTVGAGQVQSKAEGERVRQEAIPTKGMGL